MCQEVFQIVQGMDKKHIETKLALQCAPLITGIKISNLLIVSSEDEESVRTILRKTGISYYRLLRQEKKTTFLLFYRSKLCTYLKDSDVQNILLENDYQDLSFGMILRQFQMRYKAYMNQEAQFPHEMGVLLGYPVEDVRGFIEHKGQNFLYSGYWKVYQDVAQKKALFAKYEEAKETLIRLLDCGIGIRLIIEIYREDFMVDLQEKKEVA
ncbi:MAG: DUF3793 family protein [Lachnospiraceae bacterium]|nr:DUF3793 family protein [Lachnospiraceae bacterium]